METIQDRAKRWRAAMKSSSTGPLIIAKEVMDVAENWDEYRNETEDPKLSPAGWLQGVFGHGKGIEWWRRRANAVDVLGEWVRRCVDHNVAVWVANAVPSDMRKRVSTALIKGARENGDNPLTSAQARPLVTKIIGKRPGSRRHCGRCAELEKILRANGIEVPGEEPVAAE